MTINLLVEMYCDTPLCEGKLQVGGTEPSWCEQVAKASGWDVRPNQGEHYCPDCVDDDESDDND